ncbi:hypothetical protein HUJ04_003177 [Dendroctonus ponderosae]|nr:hypothetical protein HUJ04_003177 [Dendroctonus ponderosae]
MGIVLVKLKFEHNYQDKVPPHHVALDLVAPLKHVTSVYFAVDLLLQTFLKKTRLYGRPSRISAAAAQCEKIFLVCKPKISRLDQLIWMKIDSSIPHIRGYSTMPDIAGSSHTKLSDDQLR